MKQAKVKSRKGTAAPAAKSRRGAGKSVEKHVFDQSKEVRAIARERVGTVKPGHAILPKDLRKKPKHKKPLAQEDEV
jgi:hypothetical protein